MVSDYPKFSAPPSGETLRHTPKVFEVQERARGPYHRAKFAMVGFEFHPQPGWPKTLSFCLFVCLSVCHAFERQTAGWMKLVLGMEVGLSPGDFMLDGDPVPFPKKGRSPPPNFRPISIVPKRLDASRCHSVWR